MKQLGERLRHFRKSQDLTQEGLARALKIHFQSILRYEKEVMAPGADIVIALAEKFRLNPNWLLLGLDPMYLPKEGEPVKGTASRVREGYLDYRLAPPPNALVEMAELPVLKSLAALVSIPPSAKNVAARTLLPKSWLMHPKETCIVQVEHDNLSSLLGKGDYLVLDWSQRGASFAEGGVVAVRFHKRIMLKRFVLTPMCYFFEDDQDGKPIRVNKEEGSPIIACGLFALRRS